MKKISIKKRDDTGAIISVQNNEGGVFGPAQDIELSKEEITGLTFDEVMHVIYGENMVPKKSFTILPNIMSMKQKAVYLLGGIGVILSFVVAAMIPKQSPQTLQNEIKQIRADREKTYDKCVAVCDSERSVFDARVNHKKAIIKKIEE